MISGSFDYGIIYIWSMFSKYQNQIMLAFFLKHSTLLPHQIVWTQTHISPCTCSLCRFWSQPRGSTWALKESQVVMSFQCCLSKTNSKKDNGGVDCLLRREFFIRKYFRIEFQLTTKIFCFCFIRVILIFIILFIIVFPIVINLFFYASFICWTHKVGLELKISVYERSWTVWNQRYKNDSIRLGSF